MKSCSNCKYADYYPCYWSFNLDPFCRLGHGLCRVDKYCSDFELLGRNGR